MECSENSNLANDKDMVMYSNSRLFGKNHMKAFHLVDPMDIFASFEKYIHMGEKNPYYEAIERANFFMRHGLNPVYMADESGAHIVVSSEEHIGLELN